jgi:hypothetical protein
MPTASIAEGISNQDSLTEQPQASGSQPHERAEGSSTPPPMPLRSPSETESWTPKARRRG